MNSEELDTHPGAELLTLVLSLKVKFKSRTTSILLQNEKSISEKQSSLPLKRNMDSLTFCNSSQGSNLLFEWLR